MNKRELINRTAAGLRAMGEKPDAFIFIDIGGDQVWENQEILGIPVFHFDFYAPFDIYDIAGPKCCFMPIWKSERSNKLYLSKKFFAGWENLEDRRK